MIYEYYENQKSVTNPLSRAVTAAYIEIANYFLELILLESR